MLNMYRLTKDLNMKCRKKIKLLEDNSDEYLCGLKLEKNFKYAKKNTSKTRIDRSDYIKIVNLLFTKKKNHIESEFQAKNCEIATQVKNYYTKLNTLVSDYINKFQR